MRDFLSETARLSLLGSKALALSLLSIPAVPSCLLTHAQDNCRWGHGTFLTHGTPESSEDALPPTSRFRDMVLGGREQDRMGPSRPFHAWLAWPAPHCLQRPFPTPLLSSLPGSLQRGTCGVSVAHSPSRLIEREPWAVSLTGTALGNLMTRDILYLGFPRSGCGGLTLTRPFALTPADPRAAGPGSGVSPGAWWGRKCRRTREQGLTLSH